MALNSSMTSHAGACGWWNARPKNCVWCQKSWSVCKPLKQCVWQVQKALPFNWPLHLRFLESFDSPKKTSSQFLKFHQNAEHLYRSVFWAPILSQATKFKPYRMGHFSSLAFFAARCTTLGCGTPVDGWKAITATPTPSSTTTTPGLASQVRHSATNLSLIHIWRCRRRG